MPVDPDPATIGPAEQWWRRLLAEVVGTALLVLAGAGAPAVDALSGGRIGRVAAVTAPGLTVCALILTLGATSGAHFNPVVSLAFALRREFPWGRVPGYWLAQLLGAVTASWVLGSLLHTAHARDVVPAPGLGLSAGAALIIEAILTFGLLTVILGTASSAQNVGHLSAVGVGSAIVLAGLWASPATGAAMNPVRFLGPALVAGRLANWPVYVLGPTAGSLAAVALAYALRGSGGDPAAAKAAQG